MTKFRQTSSAPTRAPWTVGLELDILSADGISVARVHDEIVPSQESEANARLIAAAPELLKLAIRYSSDCQTRIEILNEEMQEAGLVPEDEDARDLNDQIDHWSATKRMADNVISIAS